MSAEFAFLGRSRAEPGRIRIETRALHTRFPLNKSPTLAPCKAFVIRSELSGWFAVVGLLPIPGPIDEGVLLIVAGLLWVFYRDSFKDAWSRAA
jgi:hypothetical protein